MPTIVTDHEASPGQLPHTLEVDRGIAVRLYLWTYAANKHNINTCKMFWAFVFMPLILPFSAIIHGVGASAHWIDNKFPGKPVAYAPPKPPRVGPSKGERFLEAFSGFMAKVWFKLQPLLKWGGIAVGVGITTVLIYLIVTNVMVFLAGLLFAGAFGLGLAAFVAVALGIIMWLDKSERARGFGRLMAKLGRSVHDHTCANVKVKD